MRRPVLQTLQAILLGAAALTGQSSAAQDNYYGLWIPDGFWYPCEVLEKGETTRKVRFFDGDEETLDTCDFAIVELKPGNAVWVALGPKRLFHHGYLQSRNGDSFKVKYDDGTTGEAGIADIRIKLTHTMLAEGIDVFARWQADGNWYGAEVIGFREGQVQVKFDDDGTERWLPRNEISRYQVTAGDDVEVNCNDEGTYFKAVVLKRDKDEYRVRYSDNSEADVTRAQMRLPLDQLRVK